MRQLWSRLENYCNAMVSTYSFPYPRRTRLVGLGGYSHKIMVYERHVLRIRHAEAHRCRAPASPPTP